MRPLLGFFAVVATTAALRVRYDDGFGKFSCTGNTALLPVCRDDPIVTDTLDIVRVGRNLLPTCTPARIAKVPLRIFGAGFMGGIFNSWVAQILLMEHLQMPVKIVSDDPAVEDVMDFYEFEASGLKFGATYSMDALITATSDWTCANYTARGKRGECAHLMPQVWSGQDLAYTAALSAGPNGGPGVAKLGRSGVIASFKWMTMTWVIERYPHISSFRGLRNRADAARFQRPSTLTEYCARGDFSGDQVSWLGNSRLCNVVKTAMLDGNWTDSPLVFKSDLTAAELTAAELLAKSFFIQILAISRYQGLSRLSQRLSELRGIGGGSSLPFWRGTFTQAMDAGLAVGTLVTAPCTWSVRDQGIIQGLRLDFVPLYMSDGSYEDDLAEVHDAALSWQTPILMNVGVPGVPPLRESLGAEYSLSRVHLPEPFSACTENRTSEADRCANDWNDTPCDYPFDLTYKVGPAFDIPSLPRYMQQAVAALSDLQLNSAADEEFLYRSLIDPEWMLLYPDSQMRARAATCQWIQENEDGGVRWGAWMQQLAKPVCPNDCIALGKARGNCVQIPGQHVTFGQCICDTAWGNPRAGCSECAAGYHLVLFRDGSAEEYDCARCPVGNNREVCSGQGSCNGTYIATGSVLPGPDSPCTCDEGYTHYTVAFSGACELKKTDVEYISTPMRALLGTCACLMLLFLLTLGLQLIVRRNLTIFTKTPLWLPLSLVGGGLLGVVWVAVMILDISTFVCHGRIWFGALTVTTTFSLLWGYLHIALVDAEEAMNEGVRIDMLLQGANHKLVDSLEHKSIRRRRVELLKTIFTIITCVGAQMVLLGLLSLTENLKAERVITEDLKNGLRLSEVQCTGDNYLVLLFGIVGIAVFMVFLSISAAYRIQEQELAADTAYTRFTAYAVYAGSGLFFVVLPVIYTLQSDTAGMYTALCLAILVVDGVVQGLGVLPLVLAAHTEHLQALDESLQRDMENLGAAARHDALLDLARKRATGSSSPLHTIASVLIPPVCFLTLLVPPALLFEDRGIFIASFMIGAALQSGGMYAIATLGETLEQWRHEAKIRSYRELDAPAEKAHAHSKVSVLRVAGKTSGSDSSTSEDEKSDSDSWNSNFSEEDSTDIGSDDEIALLTAHDTGQAMSAMSHEDGKIRQLITRFHHSRAGRMRDSYMLALTPLWCISYFWATYSLTYEGSGSSVRWSDAAFPNSQKWMESVLYWAFALDIIFEMLLATNHVQWLRSSFTHILPLISYIPVYLFGVNMLGKTAFTAYITMGFLRFVHMNRVPQFFMRYRSRGQDSPQHKATTQIMIYCTTLAVGACMIAGVMFAFEGPLQELELHHFFYFAIVTMSTVGFGDISPGTTFMQLLITSIIILGLVFVPYLAGEIARLTTIKNHIGEIPSQRDDLVTLICATLPPHSLNRVLLEVSTGSNSNMGKVCVVSEDPPTDEFASVIHKHSHVTTRMAYYSGSTLHERTLSDCHFASASTCIIVSSLSSDNADDEDDSTVARVLALKHVLSSTARVIVQLRKGGKGFRYLQQHGVTDIACVARLRSRLCGANAITPGMATLVLGLCSKERGNPILDWQKQFIRGLSVSVFTAFVPKELGGILFHEFTAFAMTVGRVLPIGTIMQFASRSPLPILNPGSGLALREGDLIVCLSTRQQLVDNAIEGMVRILEDPDLDTDLRRRIDSTRLSYGRAERLANEYSSRAELIMLTTENEETRLHREASLISASRMDVSTWLPVREYFVHGRAPPQDSLVVPTVASVGIKDHILVSAHEKDLFDILQPLRARTLKSISPVVIMAAGPLDPIVWGAVGRFQDVFILIGDSSDDVDLERAGVSLATCVMLLLDNRSEDSDMRSIVKLSALTAAQHRGAKAERYEKELKLTRKRMREEAVDESNSALASAIRHQVTTERKTSTVVQNARKLVRQQTAHGSLLFRGNSLDAVSEEGNAGAKSGGTSVLEGAESLDSAPAPHLLSLRASLQKRQMRGVSMALSRAGSLREEMSGTQSTLLTGLGDESDDSTEPREPNSIFTMLEFREGASVLHAELSAATKQSLSHEAVGADGDPLLRLVAKDEFAVVRKRREAMLHAKEIDAMRRMKDARERGHLSTQEIRHFTLTRSYASGSAFSMQALDGLIGQMVHTDHVSAVVDELVLPHTGLTMAGLQSRVVLTEVPADAEGFTYVELLRSLALGEEILPIAIFRRHVDGSSKSGGGSGRASRVWADWASSDSSGQSSRYVICFPPPDLTIQPDDLLYVLARGANITARVAGAEMTTTVMGIERTNT